MKAQVLHNIGDLRYEDVPTPMPREGEVLLRVGACGVCGSDIPRIFSKGTYRFPTIPGHEFSGTVAAVGKGVNSRLVGSRAAVFPLIPCRACGPCSIGAFAQCEHYDYLGSRSDGAFAEFVRVPEWNLLALPPDLSLEEAALVEPAAVAVHALRRANVEFGDSVLIFGAGPIGLLVAMWAKASGAAKVLVVDIDLERLRFARKVGLLHLLDARKEDFPEWVRKKTEDKGADIVVEASGSAVALEQAMLCARTFGKVVLLGNPSGGMALSQEAYWAILRKELRLSGSWNSSYNDEPRNEWKLALDFMAAGKLDVKPLITHSVPLDALWDHLLMMRDRSAFSNKILYTNPEAQAMPGQAGRGTSPNRCEVL